MGPSGSGKTTLLRVVAGLEAPDRGRVSWNGEDVTRLPPHRRGFGLMFQDFALFPHRTVAENVGFGLRMEHRSPREVRTRVDEVLALVGLEGYGGRAIEGLSGGEQQRVALARTLAPSPRLVMLDEPVGSLDRELRDRLVVEMRSIFTSLGVTALYVTHDREEAFAIADGVAVMDAGRIVRTGPPQELWEDPGTEFVARLLGHHNILADGDSLEAAGLLGDLRLDGAAVLVPADAIEIEPSESGAGTVRRVTYRGARHEVEVDVAGNVLTTERRGAISPGSSVDVRLDERRVIRLTR